MAREESEQERWAREVVEGHLGVELTFVDTGVPVDSLHDFEFYDPSGVAAALEVTSLTDEKLRGAFAGYRRSSPKYGPAASLTSCWEAMVTQREARYRDLTSRLEPHLLVLERVGVAFNQFLQPAQVWDRYDGFGRPDVAEALRGLRSNHVEYVTRFPGSICETWVEDGEVHSHRVIVAMVGGFHAEGSEASLEVLEADVAGHPDNLRKLRNSGAGRRHLFVVLDSATDGGVSRPFRGDDVTTEWEHFGLPDRGPQLPAEVDELWVVLEESGSGWRWDGARWERVAASPKSAR